MPWSTKVRRLQTKVEIASVDTEMLFRMVSQEVFRWCSFFCGCLPKPVFMFYNPAIRQEQVHQELVHEVRAKRLTALLQQEAVEMEYHFLNFEFEETQIKIELGDLILQCLLEETVLILQNL
jgi:hypothetical protein